MDLLYEELAEALRKGASKDELAKLKVRLSKKYGLKRVPADTELILKSGLPLRTKPVRTGSGVAPLALMTAPFACPHGKCIYCPGGPGSAFGDVPQSYTGFEPSSMRGKRNFYDPYLMTFNRLEQYIVNGHMPDKVEIIVQGGTFPAFPKDYQDSFIVFTLKGLNDFGELFCKDGVDFEKVRSFFEIPGDMKNPERVERIQQKVSELKGESSLEIEKERNEKAIIRCVALCIETKPNWCFEPHINEMLKQGTTRVELGVQCLDDDVLKRINRGHDLSDVVKATKLMRNSLLKVGYHMMPGLPGNSLETDKIMFKELFSNPDYKPDALKIYPTLVMKGTGLWGLWKAGNYVPRTVEEMAEMIVEAKRYVPKWCRIMRIQRDIPSTVIEAGPVQTNLRQLVEKKLKEKGIVCKCIRCREPKGKDVDWDSVKLLREDYEANGEEIFLSFEDTKNDLLLGFCRLRIIQESFRPEIQDKCAGIRELHVYGQAVPIGQEGSVQHKGLGAKLLAEAERVAKEEFFCNKMTVISGVGVREYYYKHGYKLDGVYVSKEL